MKLQLPSHWIRFDRQEKPQETHTVTNIYMASITPEKSGVIASTQGLEPSEIKGRSLYTPTPPPTKCEDKTEKPPPTVSKESGKILRPDCGGKMTETPILSDEGPISVSARLKLPLVKPKPPSAKPQLPSVKPKPPSPVKPQSPPMKPKSVLQAPPKTKRKQATDLKSSPPSNSSNSPPVSTSPFTETAADTTVGTSNLSGFNHVETKTDMESVTFGFAAPPPESGHNTLKQDPKTISKNAPEGKSDPITKQGKDKETTDPSLDCENEYMDMGIVNSDADRLVHSVKQDDQQKSSVYSSNSPPPSPGLGIQPKTPGSTDDVQKNEYDNKHPKSTPESRQLGDDCCEDPKDANLYDTIPEREALYTPLQFTPTPPTKSDLPPALPPPRSPQTTHRNYYKKLDTHKKTHGEASISSVLDGVKNFLVQKLAETKQSNVTASSSNPASPLQKRSSVGKERANPGTPQPTKRCGPSRPPPPFLKKIKNREVVESMDRQQILDLLEAMNLSEYHPFFKKHQIDGRLLLKMSLQQFEEAGMNESMTHIRLMEVIAGQRDIAEFVSNPNAVTSTYSC